MQDLLDLRPCALSLDFPWLPGEMGIVIPNPGLEWWDVVRREFADGIAATVEEALQPLPVGVEAVCPFFPMGSFYADVRFDDLDDDDPTVPDPEVDRRAARALAATARKIVLDVWPQVMRQAKRTADRRAWEQRVAALVSAPNSDGK